MQDEEYVSDIDEDDDDLPPPPDEEEEETDGDIVADLPQSKTAPPLKLKVSKSDIDIKTKPSLVSALRQRSESSTVLVFGPSSNTRSTKFNIPENKEQDTDNNNKSRLAINRAEYRKLRKKFGSDFSAEMLEIDPVKEARQKIAKTGFQLPLQPDGTCYQLSNLPCYSLYQLHKQIPDSSNLSIGASQELSFSESYGLPDTPSMIHLIVRVQLQGLLPIGEPLECFCLLWSKMNRQFITEEYCFHITPSGLMTDLDLLPIFYDLTRKDFVSNIVVVIKLYRRGRLKVEDIGKPMPKKLSGFREAFLRPCGCCCFVLDEGIMKLLSSQRSFTSSAVPIILPKDMNKSGSEHLFSKLHEIIINKKVDDYYGDEALIEHKGSKGFIFDFKLLINERVQNIIATDPEMKYALLVPPLTINNPTALAEKKNEMNLFLLDGEFGQGRKTSQHNIEVRVTLRDESGQIIPKVFSRGITRVGHFDNLYCSVIFYHCNSPRIYERITVKLPEELRSLQVAYLCMEFVHCSSSKGLQPFAYTFLPLTSPSGEFSPDQLYKLYCYKYPKTGHMVFTREPQLLQKILTEDWFSIQTQLKSTKFTLDPDIHKLLNYITFPDTAIPPVLEAIAKKEPLKIIRYCPMVFEKLFSILSTSNKDNVTRRVYQSLVSVCANLSANPAFSSLVLNSIETDMKVMDIYPILTHYLFEHLKWATSESVRYDEILFQGTKDSLASFSLLSAIITRSFSFDTLQSVKSHYTKDEFIDKLLPIFECTCILVCKTKPAFIAALQQEMLKKWVFLFKNVFPIFVTDRIDDLSEAVAAFLDGVPINRPQIILDKLSLMKQIIGVITQKPLEERMTFLRPLFQQLQRHCGKDDLQQGAFCMLLLADLLPSLDISAIKSSSSLTVAQLLPATFSYVELLLADEYSRKMLNDPSLKHPKITHPSLMNTQILPDGVSSLLSFMTLLDENMFRGVFVAIQEQSYHSAYNFICNGLSVFSFIISNSCFDNTWLVMRMLECQTALALLKWSSSILLDFFTQGSTFRQQLWEKFFELLFKLLTSPVLAIERQIEQYPLKARFIQDNYGDLRLPVLEQFKMTWPHLSSYYVLFAHVLNQSIISLCTHPIEEIKDFCRKVYFDIIKSEYANTRSFKSVAVSTIDQINLLCSEYGENIKTIGRQEIDQYIDFFNVWLRNALASVSESFGEDWSKKTCDFLNDIISLFEHLLSIQALPRDKAYEIQRTQATLHLLDYLKENAHQHVYQFYVDYLYQIHLEIDNPIQQGLALLLHASDLSWSSNLIMPALGQLPEETERLRHMRLLEMAIKAFDRSSMWEKSIEVCKIMADVCENILFDIPRVCSLLKSQASYHEMIIFQSRIFNQFYRVVFYGPVFDQNDAGKEFVFSSGEGVQPERLNDFVTRMKKTFPSAKVVDINYSPESKENVIQITSLTPSCQEEIDGKPSKWTMNLDVPKNIRDYNSQNNVRIFSYTKPSKPPKTVPQSLPKNEIRDLWTLKTFLVSEELLPSLRRRVKIIQHIDREITPIENAILTLRKKNLALKELILSAPQKDSKLSTQNNQNDTSFIHGKFDLNQLHMMLHGIIDAAVNGGIVKFREAFFENDFSYFAQYPNHLCFLDDFQSLLKEQNELLNQGLDLFSALADDSLRPAHQHLTDTFLALRGEMLALLVKPSAIPNQASEIPY